MNNPNEKLNIGLWYRPPANSSALDILYSTLESLDVSFLSSFVLLGDFNIDFYNTGHPLFSKLDNMSNDFLLSQVVEQPTRTNPHSNYSSLIDLVLLSTTS